jgi:hypothetical protein
MQVLSNSINSSKNVEGEGEFDSLNDISINKELVKSIKSITNKSFKKV